MSPLQLSVRGKPSAFDLSLSNDICVIASPGCLSFFHLNGYGSPKQVIHYEQPQQIRQLKYQRGGNQLLAAIRGGGLSLWDPNKPLRPLQGVCRGNGWITDMDWCYNNTNCLVTSSDNGDILLWDSRISKKPTNTINTGNITSNVLFCPNNSNIITSIVDNSHIVYIDSRMISDNRNDCLNIIDVDSEIIKTSWSINDSTDNTQLMVATLSNTLEWYNIDPNNNKSSLDNRIRCSFLTSYSHLLSTPTGRGAIITNFDPKTSSTLIYLQGGPKDGYNLEKIYQPPNTDEINDGPFTHIATLQNSNILGIRFGTPGRLIPPSHSGYELLVLSDTSIIYPIKINNETIKKYCYNITSASSNKSSSGSLLKHSSSKPTIDLSFYSPKYSLDKLKTSVNLPIDSNKSYHSNDHINSTTTSNEYTKPNTNKSDSIDNLTGETFWNYLKEEILYLEVHINNNLFPHLNIGRLDQYARQLTLEMQYIKKSKGKVTDDKIDALIDENDFDKSVSLIIFFPTKVSSQSLPTLTIKTTSSIEFVNNHFISSLINELTQITKSSLILHERGESKLTSLSLTNDNDLHRNGFLVDISRLFHNRIIQAWDRNESIYQISNNIPNDLILIDSPQSIHEKNEHSDVSDNTQSKSSDDTTSDVKNNYFNIIEQKAYKLPCPATSGGIFSSRGILICFGGSSISYSSETNDNTNFNSNTINITIKSYPKTYADMLVIKRVKRENSNIKIQSDNDVIDKSRHNSIEKDDRNIFDDSSKDSNEIDLFSPNSGFNKPKILKPQISQNSLQSFNSSKGQITPKSYISKSNTTRSDLLYDNIEIPDHFIPLLHASNRSRTISESSKSKNSLLYFYDSINKSKDFNQYSDNILQDTLLVSSNPCQVTSYEINLLAIEELGCYYSLGPHSNCIDIVAIGNLDHTIIIKQKESFEVNKSIATLRDGSKELMQIWQILSISMDILLLPLDNYCLINWYNSSLDFVTLGATICILGGSNNVLLLCRKSSDNNVDNNLKYKLENSLFMFIELLMRYGEIVKANEVRKIINKDSITSLNQLSFNKKANEDQYKIFVHNSCYQCNNLCGFSKESTLICKHCKYYSLLCCICQLPIKGNVFTCKLCGHGGHPNHIKMWFEDNSECPVGCGCICRGTVTYNHKHKTSYDNIDTTFISDDDNHSGIDFENDMIDSNDIGLEINNDDNDDYDTDDNRSDYDDMYELDDENSDQLIMS